jgi:hypothetical protein
VTEELQARMLAGVDRMTAGRSMAEQEARRDAALKAILAALR